MGITHHSNYIRWMEEARIDFLRQLGWEFSRLEAAGIASPVVEVSCRYRRPTTFADTVVITVTLQELRSVKLVLRYEMKDLQGQTVAEGESVHCFLGSDGRPLRLAKQHPEFYQALVQCLPADGSEDRKPS